MFKEKNVITDLILEFNLPETDADIFPPLDLAYIGDSVYELTIRTCLLSGGAMPVDKLNRKATYFAKAVTQAKIVTNIFDNLTEAEQNIYRKGRNAKSYSPSKSATLGEYHKATGFEALIGWLYLKKEYKRMYEIIHMGWDSLEKAEQETEQK